MPTLGNPDWQRRYAFSAVPISTPSFVGGVSRTTGVIDAAGFSHLIINYNASTLTAYHVFQILWYSDSTGATVLTSSEWVAVPGSVDLIKVPVMTRYFGIKTVYKSGTTGGALNMSVFCTDAEEELYLTQRSAEAVTIINQSIAAGATVTVFMSELHSGECMINMDDNTNNLWTAWCEYFDWPSANWQQFWSAHGKDKGQGWTERIFLPAAPVRVNARNDDTVAHIIQQYVVPIK